MWKILVALMISAGIFLTPGLVGAQEELAEKPWKIEFIPFPS
jgi:hypothetical protein